MNVARKKPEIWPRQSPQRLTIYREFPANANRCQNKAQPRGRPCAGHRQAESALRLELDHNHLYGFGAGASSGFFFAAAAGLAAGAGFGFQKVGSS